MLASALLMVFPVLLAFAAANDLFTMKIPNRISLALIAGFVVAALAAGFDAATIGYHLAASAIVLVATFTLFTFQMLGGGDAKLMAAAGLWMGWSLVLEFVIFVTVFGGILAVLILAYRKLVPATALQLPGWAMRLHEKGTGIPYGIAIAAAGLLCYPETEIFRILAV